jgi:hypothetical protein
MKRFILSLLCLCMTCVVHAEGGDTSIKQTLRISKSDGRLIAEPGYIYLDQQNAILNVETNLAFTCKASGIEVKPALQTILSCPSTEQSSESPKLIFAVPNAKDPVKDFVSVAVITSSTETPFLLYFGLLLLFFIVFSMGRWLGVRDLLTTVPEPRWWDRFLPAKTPSMEMGLRSLSKELDKLRQNLSTPPVLPTRSSELEQRIATFVGAAENWRREIGGEFPQQVKERLEKIKNLRPKLTSGEQDNKEFRATTGTIVQLIVWDCDDRYDPEYQNNRLQIPIRQMTEAAGLELVNPARGQRFLETEHKQVRIEPAPTPAQHGQIAKTVRRGIKDSQSIICKAEVHIFD